MDIYSKNIYSELKTSTQEIRRNKFATKWQTTEDLE